MTPELFEKLQAIARTKNISTLATRHCDRQDFREMHIEVIKDLMEVAYEAGVASVKLPEPVEVVAKKYLVDLSKAVAWPEDLNDKLYNCTLDCFEITQREESEDYHAPIPVDYTVSIDGDFLVLEGTAVSMHGYCMVKVRKSYEAPTGIYREYDIVVCPSEGASEQFLALKKQFEGYGVKFVPATDE